VCEVDSHRTTEMDLLELRWEGMDCFALAQDRDRWWAVVNLVVDLRFP